MKYSYFRSVVNVLIGVVGCVCLSGCGSSRQQASKNVLLENIQQQVAENQFLSLDENEMEKIAHAVLKVGKYRDKFDTLFKKWEDEWINGSLKYSSNSRDAMKIKEYQELVGMGDKIIPLVIEKLVDKGNFIAVHLYNALQKEKSLISPFMLAMQDQAAKTVKLWVEAQK